MSLLGSWPLLLLDWNYLVATFVDELKKEELYQAGILLALLLHLCTKTGSVNKVFTHP